MSKNFKILKTGIVYFFMLANLHSLRAQDIPDCFISFKGYKSVTNVRIDRLPAKKNKYRILPTTEGLKKISQLDGYRILYNKQNFPFVNLKVEYSDSKAYQDDQKNLLAHLNFISNHSGSKGSVEVKVNGYSIYGFNNSTSANRIIGSFVIFPQKNVIIYIDFEKPEKRSYNNQQVFLEEQNIFFEYYTTYLKKCHNK
ncbi:hypothetical protein [Flavobacterium daejeonense]|uniref:hypothetical protein n=1 Tax=Flavobacterium daejeonense TaxID=350893 RepID=UPI00047B80DB|nr:hypothetical protein [Flavobacterium daejeonense]